MRKERKHYTAEEKVAILRRHLLDKVAVSDLCEELGLQPTVFYRWQKEFFENGAAAFQNETERFRQPSEQGWPAPEIETPSTQVLANRELTRQIQADSWMALAWK